MPDQAHFSLGDALELCYDVALDDWRRKYAPSTAAADLFAAAIVTISTQTNFMAGGRANCTITITGRRRGTTDVFFHVLQRQNGLWTFPEENFSEPQG